MLSDDVGLNEKISDLKIYSDLKFLNALSGQSQQNLDDLVLKLENLKIEYSILVFYGPKHDFTNELNEKKFCSKNAT